MVKAACENLESTEADLSRYLRDTHQVLGDLQRMLTAEAAA